LKEDRPRLAKGGNERLSGGSELAKATPLIKEENNNYSEEYARIIKFMSTLPQCLFSAFYP
jgi:hypothetical protein